MKTVTDLDPATRDDVARWRIQERICGVTVHTWTLTGTPDQAWDAFRDELRWHQHRYTPGGTSRLVLTVDGAK